jgi:hypothetical protein
VYAWHYQIVERGETMKQDRVVLRRWRAQPKSIIALFPDEMADYRGNVDSYEHVGQHGGADYSRVIRITTPVREIDAEVDALLQELESIGYCVKLVQHR